MAVRQSNNPLNHLSDFQSGEMIDIGYTSPEEERAKELIKQKKDAVCSLPDKKAFASTCLALENDVIKGIKSVEPSGSSNLSSQMGGFLSWKNKRAIKNSSNKQHAPLLAKLVDIVSIIDQHLQEQEGGSVTHFTHHGAQGWRARLW